MSKVEPLTSINASYTGISKLNSHLEKIEAAFDNTLSRDGSTPNFMEAPIDMNGNQLLNVSEPTLEHHVATKQYVDGLAFPDSDPPVAAVPDGVINVLDPTYGVTGGGLVDDLAGLNAAVTAAGGKTLYFPPGTNCLVSGTLVISGTNTRVIAHNATITKAGTFTGTAVVRISAEDVAVEGLIVNGTDSTVIGLIGTSNVAAGMKVRGVEVYNATYGISGNNNSDVTIEDCLVHDCGNYPIWVQNTGGTQAYSKIVVQNNYVDTSHLNPATATAVGLHVRGDATYPTTDVKISGNTILMPLNPTSSGAVGCEMRFVDGGTFSNNYCLNGAMTVSVAASTTVAVVGNICENQTFYAIEVASLTGSPNLDVSVADNTITGGGILNYGIGVQGFDLSQRLTITGNTIKDTTLYGIFVNNQWDWVTIVGNSIDMATAGSQYGIYVSTSSGAVDNLVISGNLLNGNAVAKKAIYLDDCSNASITGNVIKDWTENPLLLQSDTGTVDYITVTGNVIRSSGNILMSGAGAFGTRIRVYNNADARISNTVGTHWRDLAAAVADTWGTGDPEGAVTAGIGSTFIRTNGAYNTTLYVKENGTGNTGWVPANAIRREFTAANLADPANSANTLNKRQGVVVWDTTNNRAMRASGAVASDLWYAVDGSTFSGAVNKTYRTSKYCVGDGSTNDYTAFNALHTTAAAAGGTIIVDNLVRLGTNMTVTTPLIVEAGGFSVDSARVLTVSSPIAAGRFQIFQGSGTVTWNAIQKEIYPEWWGVKSTVVSGYSSSANLTAINALHASVTAGTYGVEVHWANKQYVFSSGWDAITKNSVVHKGAGGATLGTWFIFENTTGNDVTYTNCQHGVIKDIAFWPSTVKKTSGYAIKFDGVYGGVVENCNFNYCYDAIEIDDSTETVLFHNDFRYLLGTRGVNYTGSNGAGSYRLVIINMTSNNPWPQVVNPTTANVKGNWATTTAYILGDIVVANGKLWQCTTAGTSAGAGSGPSATPGTTGENAFTTTTADNTAAWKFVCSNELTWICQDNYAYSLTCRQGSLINGAYALRQIDTATTGTSYPVWMFTAGIDTDHTYYSGITATRGEGVYASDMWLGSSLTAHGLNVASTHRGEVTLVNSRVMGNARHGVFLNAPGAVITGNQIGKNSVESSGTYHGVGVSANVNRFVVGNNIIGGLVGGGSEFQGYGVLVTVGTSDRYTITNNVCNGNVTGGVSDGGSGANKTVSGNVT